jgi:Restriction endonuclease
MTDYDFLPLSPVDFEALAGDLLRASQQLVLERFGPGRDKGIDLRCAISGLTVVQCKHFHRSGSPKLKSALRQEVMKWQTSHSVDRYIIYISYIRVNESTVER